MQLNSIVPWGRSFDEYRAMFNLTEAELTKTILGCSDGPASFNAELSKRGGSVVSIDPLYQFSQAQIAARIEQVYPQVIEQVELNKQNFIWQDIESPQQLGELRMASMQQFLNDFEQGLQQGRYQTQALPKLNFADQQFELALCSHFLFLYSELFDLQQHIASLLQLTRVAKQVRIYPLVTLDNKISTHLNACIEALNEHGFSCRLENVSYQFQRGATEMLVID